MQLDGRRRPGRRLRFRVNRAVSLERPVGSSLSSNSTARWNRIAAIASASLRQRRCPCSLRSGARTRRRHAYAPDATSPARWRFGCSSVASVSTRLAQTLALHRRHHEIWGPAPHSGITIRRARATRGPRAAPSRNDLGCLGDEAVLVQSKEPPDGSRARSSRPPGPSPARKWGRTASSARWS